MRFEDRIFTNIICQLYKVNAKLQGSYQIDVFAIEDEKVAHFMARLLPSAAYHAVKFAKAPFDLQLHDEQLSTASQTLGSIVSRYRAEWTDKVSLQERLKSFVGISVDNQSVEIPEKVLGELFEEIERLFQHPSMVLYDKKGKPYFSNPRFGRFWLTDLGYPTQSQLEQYGITIS